MKYLVLSLSAMLMFCICVSAQSKHTSTIQGRVVNEQGEPEGGVKVKVTNHGCFKKATTTDAYGMYQLQLEPGKYNLAIQHKKGTPDDKDVEVSGGEKLKINFSEKDVPSKQQREIRESSEM